MKLCHDFFQVNIWVWKKEPGPNGNYFIEKNFYYQNEEFTETWRFLFEEPTILGTVCHVLPLQDNRPDDIFDMEVTYIVKRKRPLSPIRL